MRGAGGGDLLEVGDAEVGLEQRVHKDRALQARLGLQLGEQAVDVVDVPGALDLRDHDDLELVPDLPHQFGDVVEHPRRGELVDARPQRGVAEIHFPAHLDQTGAGGELAIDGHRVLEVAEQDVHGGGDVGDLGHHLLVREVQEVDHPGGLEGDLARRLGGVDGEGLEEVAGVTQVGSPGFRFLGRGGRCDTGKACRPAPARGVCPMAAPGRAGAWAYPERYRLGPAQ